VSTSNTHQARQPRRWCREVLAVACAFHLGTAIAQGGAPRAEAPTVKVGDRWKSEQTDRRTGAKESEFDRRVTAVTESRIEGTENDGRFVWTSELNALESSVSSISGDPKGLSFPLEVGKKWDYKFSYVNKLNAGKGRQQLSAHVVAYEKVKVPAGEFDAFKIEYTGFWNNDANNRSGRFKNTGWYAPAARSVVRFELDDGYNNWVRQLVEFQLQP